MRKRSGRCENMCHIFNNLVICEWKVVGGRGWRHSVGHGKGGIMSQEYLLNTCPMVIIAYMSLKCQPKGFLAGNALRASGMKMRLEI